MPPSNEPDDLFDFDDILNLEEKYHKEGYDEGYKDGAEAGLIEGRSVGLKKGFEKFLEAGRLQGRAIIWANRIPSLKKELEEEHASGDDSQREAPQDEKDEGKDEEKDQDQDIGKGKGKEEASSSSQDEKKPEPIELPPLNSNPRLEKNIRMLYGMLEPGTLSTKNDDESVNDFDSRLKGAQARFKMIERAIREAVEKGSAEKRRRPAQPSKPVTGNDNIEDIGKVPHRGEGSGGKG
ncbi:DUF1715-domain-containing protein [Hypoxylon rubiginosum]|uniref:DUF1715-domain-containing protein n=1 Tax=Hypoxylon rubiginosum TaxID=110542 RepID=A0ACB9YYM9_9PEZI|nr:DUF1715-domain-containing protein [Hypoxylon rubiginosum]